LIQSQKYDKHKNNNSPQPGSWRPMSNYVLATKERSIGCRPLLLRSIIQIVTS